MAIASATVSVGTTATELRTGAGCVIVSCEQDGVRLGGSDVTAATGAVLPPNTPLKFVFTGSEGLYGILASSLFGSAKVRVVSYTGS